MELFDKKLKEAIAMLDPNKRYLEVTSDFTQKKRFRELFIIDIDHSTITFALASIINIKNSFTSASTRVCEHFDENINSLLHHIECNISEIETLINEVGDLYLFSLKKIFISFPPKCIISLTLPFDMTHINNVKVSLPYMYQDHDKLHDETSDKINELYSTRVDLDSYHSKFKSMHMNNENLRNFLNPTDKSSTTPLSKYLTQIKVVRNNIVKYFEKMAQFLMGCEPSLYVDRMTKDQEANKGLIQKMLQASTGTKK